MLRSDILQLLTSFAKEDNPRQAFSTYLDTHQEDKDINEIADFYDVIYKIYTKGKVQGVKIGHKAVLDEMNDRFREV
jgi:non-ribosomal peptide synthetase component F